MGMLRNRSRAHTGAPQSAKADTVTDAQKAKLDKAAKITAQAGLELSELVFMLEGEERNDTYWVLDTMAERLRRDGQYLSLLSLSESQREAQ